MTQNHTTSDIFGFGKGTIFNKITKDIALHDPCMMASCIELQNLEEINKHS